MRPQRLIRPATLPAILTLLWACGRGPEEQRTETPAPPALSTAAEAPAAETAAAAATMNLKPIQVKLRFTGLAHLVGTAADRRLIVVPNEADARHELLLLAKAAYDTELLPTTQDIVTGSQKEAMEYRVFPAGYEIDLAESGWVEPSKPTLTFTEKGDKDNPPGSAHVECPDETTAPAASLHWLPSLSAATKKPLKVKADHSKRDPSPKSILMRLEVTDGTLGAIVRKNPSRFEFDLNNKIDQNDGDHVQAIADYLELTFTAHVNPSKPFYVLKGRKFRAKPNDSDQWIELVRIKPISDKVELVFANVVKNSFFKPKEAAELMHFSHYYDVVDTSSVSKVKKVKALAKRCDPSSPGESGVECGPVRP